MTKLFVKGFFGAHDHWRDSGPIFGQHVRNLLLDEQRGYYQRPGIASWITQLATGNQAVNDVASFEGIYSTEAREHDYIFLAHAGTRTFYNSAGLDENTPSFSLGAELTQSGNPTAFNANAAARATFQKYGGAVYLNFQSDKFYSNTKQYPKPKLIRRSGSLLAVHELGLPDPEVVDSGWSLLVITGGAGNTYAYAWCYSYEYILDGVTRVERGPVSRLESTGNMGAVGTPGNSVSVDGLANLDNAFAYGAGGDYKHQWDTVNVRKEIYRTKANGTILYLVSSIDNTTTSYLDTTVDASLGPEIYNADGSYDYEEPHPAKHFHIVNGLAYYAGFDIRVAGLQPNAPQAAAIRQSIPNVFGACPADFEFTAPSAVTGLDSVDIYPVVFCRNSLWRIEGTIDSFGNGTPVLRAISETVGLLRGCRPIRTEDGLVFPAHDGFYWTNAFTIRKLSSHRDNWYRTLWNDRSETESGTGRMGGCYHPGTKRVFISAEADGIVSGANDTIITLDMRHQHPQGVAITELKGQSLAAGYSLRPRGLGIIRDTLMVSDDRGFIQKMPLEPSGSEQVDDVLPEHGVAISSFKLVPVVFDLLTACLDVGSRTTTKWWTALVANFTSRFPQSTLTVDISTVREARYTSESSKEELALKHVRETALPATSRFFQMTRNMARSGLRAVLRQYRFKKAYYFKATSTAQVAATMNGGANTAILPSTSWPTDAVGDLLYTAADNYTVGYEIAARTPTTLTVLDPGNTFPTGLYAWRVVGYQKGERFQLEGFEAEYSGMEGDKDSYKTSDEGGNT